MSYSTNSNVTGTAGSTSTTSTNPTGTAGSSAGAQAGEGIKGIFAKGHGIGESIRGNLNGAIDGLTGSSTVESEAKNSRIAQGGESEFRNGEFVKKGTTDKAL